MDDRETRGDLLPLNDPLEWRELVDPADNLPNYWQSVYPMTETRRYLFTLTPLENEALRFDKAGAPLTWWLWIGLQEVGSTEDKLFSWGFPVPNFDGAKAVCARLAITGDFTEISEMEKRWYSLRWKRIGFFDGLPAGTEGKCAPVVRHGGSGQYAAVAKKQWFVRYFTAQYTIDMPEENRREPLEVYLRKLHLHPPGKSPRRYKTQEDAKAACERHHVTGEWE